MNKENKQEYQFNKVTSCAMCGSTSHKLLGKRLNQAQGLRPKKKSGIALSIFQCKNCDLIFSNPMPIPSDIQSHYGIPPEEYWLPSYFETDPNYFEREIKQVNDLMPIKKGMRSLDIGAGLGKQMKALENAGFEAYGLEPSTPFYERAISKMGIKQERLQLSMLEEASYSKDHFDFISFGAVFEHLYQPGEALDKALEWIKPGGIIHIEVPSSKWLSSKIFNLYYKLTGSDYVANLSPMHEPYHLYEFGLKSFKLHKSADHFEIAHAQFFVCNTYLPTPLNPIVKPIMHFSNTGMQLVVYLRKK